MSSWYDTLTSTPALVAGALGITAVLYARRQTQQQQQQQPKKEEPVKTTKLKTLDKKEKMSSVMSPPAANLLPPKSDPITVANLAAFNGQDLSKPIYVAIKGTVYDVSAKTEMYGKGSGYNVFAGKDASRGLGMSSLDPKDAVADYSTLNEAQMKTLDGWETFFQKRYNVVGKVVP